MNRSLAGLIRFLGFALIAIALGIFFRALMSVDRREFLGGFLAIVVGWLCLSAGVEFLRPDTAE